MPEGHSRKITVSRSSVCPKHENSPYFHIPHSSLRYKPRILESVCIMEALWRSVGQFEWICSTVSLCAARVLFIFKAKPSLEPSAAPTSSSFCAEILERVPAWMPRISFTTDVPLPPGGMEAGLLPPPPVSGSSLCVCVYRCASAYACAGRRRSLPI